MYASGNPKTKKELTKRINAGDKVRIYDPGPFGVKPVGDVAVEGPHYPQPHRWYALVSVNKHGYATEVVE